MLQVVFPLKKDCINMCDRRLNVPEGGGLGGNAIFTKCWKSYFPQIRLPWKVWSSKLFKVQEEVLVAIQISLSDGDTISPWERLPQSVWSSWQFQSHKLGSVLVEMQFLPSIGSSIPHKLDCLKLCDRKKKYKSKLGGGFGSNAIFTQLEVQFPKCLK